mmetsp:Transcript_32584/g.52421  ORF Transcript_32584/g.52421 Transcript_32584/m.52421 type:complete len:216 (+) Transcript_32584:98-745(+)
MAWVNNNKRNARFNPNRRDDRLLTTEVTLRVHKEKKEEVDTEEAINTDIEHVLSMDSDTRVDWLSMAMMQAATGKLKAVNVFDVMKNPSFVPSESSHRMRLKAMVEANLHIFNAKQKKALEEQLARWTTPAAGNAERRSRSRSKRRRSSSSSSSSQGKAKRSKEVSTAKKGKRSASPQRRSKSRSQQSTREKRETKEQRRSRSRSRSRGRRGRRS